MMAMVAVLAALGAAAQGGYVGSEEWLHRYDAQVEALEAASDADTDTVVDALFVGSSSIKLWSGLSEAMAPLNVRNRGYGGSTMRDIAMNYPRLMAHYRPRAVVLYCDNDIAGRTQGDVTVDEAIALWTDFAARVHTDYPEATVFFLSIKHCRDREQLREVEAEQNRRMEEYARVTPYFIYVDMTSPCLDGDGNIDDTLFRPDGLHLNALGYDKWNAVLKPLLLQRLRPGNH